MTVTKKELEQQNASLEALLRQMTEERSKPSKIQKLWDWSKPYIIPFILGVVFANLVPALPFSFNAPTKIEQQAALGGAAIPFPSVTPSPSPSPSPPRNSTAESTASSWMSTYVPPLPVNPQAGAGQTTSTRYYRPPGRRMR